MTDLTLSIINDLYRIESALVTIRKKLKENNEPYDGVLSEAIHEVTRASSSLKRFSNNAFIKTETGKRLMEYVNKQDER